jgi:hypothetical protein
MTNGYVEALYMGDKESIVNLMLAVQAGNVSCRLAAGRIFELYEELDLECESLKCRG